MISQQKLAEEWPLCLLHSGQCPREKASGARRCWPEPNTGIKRILASVVNEHREAKSKVPEKNSSLSWDQVSCS